LQDGYTHNNKNPKIKYAYAILSIPTDEDAADDPQEAYIAATDGNIIYFGKVENNGDPVKKWEDNPDDFFRSSNSELNE